MFCVLLVAQLVYIKFPATPPYEELDNCLQKNVQNNTASNSMSILEILTGYSEHRLRLKEGETMEILKKTVYDFNAKSYLLRSWLKLCSDSIDDGG